MDAPIQGNILGLVSEVPEKLLLVAATLVAAPIIIRVINNLLGRLFNITTFDPTLEKFVHKTIVSLLWLLTIGLLLVIVGVNVNAVVTSIGVGSFIVGFALKDTLGNLAAGVMVLVNKPFIVGDDIEVLGIRGRVKTISMSYTKIVTEDKVKVTIPNSKVWDNPIKNYTAYKGQKQ
jgi:small conductance mechanosensitive channel